MRPLKALIFIFLCFETVGVFASSQTCLSILNIDQDRFFGQSILIDEFAASQQTQFFLKDQKMEGLNKELIPGQSYTAISDIRTGELVVGYQLKVPFLLRLLKGFTRTNAGTHITLNKHFTNGSFLSDFPENFYSGSFKLNPDGSVDVAGFSGGEANIYGAAAVANALKRLSPTLTIKVTPGRLSDIDSADENIITFYMGRRARVLEQHYYGWRVR